jgi:hypothetical protein
MIRLRQSRYLLNPELENSSASSAYDYKWEVPITFISCNDRKTVNQKWLRTSDHHIELTFPSGNFLTKVSIKLKLKVININIKIAANIDTTFGC